MRFVFTCSSNTSDFVLKDGKGAYPTFFFMFLFLKITSEVSLNYVKKKSLKGFPWNSHKKKSYDICTQREENVWFQKKFQFLFSKKLCFYIYKSN